MTNDMERKAYQHAIQILMDNNFDAKVLVVRLAKQDPVAFIALVEGAPDAAWCRDALMEMLNGNKVNAIKIIRTNTGLGLKEAKDIADQVHNLNPKLTEYGFIPNLRHDQRELATKISWSLG